MKVKLKIYIITVILFMGLFTFGQSKDIEIKTFLDDLKTSDFSGTILVAHNDKITEK